MQKYVHRLSRAVHIRTSVASPSSIFGNHRWMYSIFRTTSLHPIFRQTKKGKGLRMKRLVWKEGCIKIDIQQFFSLPVTWTWVDPGWQAWPLPLLEASLLPEVSPRLHFFRVRKADLRLPAAVELTPSRRWTSGQTWEVDFFFGKNVWPRFISVAGQDNHYFVVGSNLL